MVSNAPKLLRSRRQSNSILLEKQQMSIDSELMLAKFIVEQHGYKIEPGNIHENNQTVVDWVNNAKKIIEDKRK
tara:strand:- start:13 stop:234 length:222 start_codon:yes stop_codon:yes gene_type:complete